MEKFQNKYRIPSARLQTWDYGSNGTYFITICTKNRENYFGEIVNFPVEMPILGISTQTNNQTMQLSEIGKLAQQFWLEIPHHFSFIELGNFVVMPNHVHGILIIDKNENGLVDLVVETPNLVVVETPNLVVVETPNLVVVETPNLGVSTNNATATTVNASKKWKPNTIGSIINQYKRICTINARKIHADFNWQSRFHDHIIRNSAEFERIQNYIANNPLNWKDDKFYS